MKYEPRKREIFINAMQKEIENLDGAEFTKLFNLTRKEGYEDKIYPVAELDNMFSDIPFQELLERIGDSYFICDNPDYFIVSPDGYIEFEEEKFITGSVGKREIMSERIIEGFGNVYGAECELHFVVYDMMLRCAEVYRKKALAMYLRENAEDIAMEAIDSGYIGNSAFHASEIDEFIDTAAVDIVYDLEYFALPCTKEESEC